MAIKDAEIKVRLTKDQKELFKKIAKAQGMSMSEFIVVTTERRARRKDENIKSQKMIEDRSMRTERKLSEITERIRGNMDKKKLPKRKKFMFWIW
jgi:uncharacterized protein (DUF1778 family)